MNKNKIKLKVKQLVIIKVQILFVKLFFKIHFKPMMHNRTQLKFKKCLFRF